MEPFVSQNLQSQIFQQCRDCCLIKIYFCLYFLLIIEVNECGIFQNVYRITSEDKNSTFVWGFFWCKLHHTDFKFLMAGDDITVTNGEKKLLVFD